MKELPLILRVFPKMSDVVDFDVDEACVVLTPALKKTILARRKTMRRLEKTHTGLYQMVFWDWEVTFAENSGGVTATFGDEADRLAEEVSIHECVRAPGPVEDFDELSVEASRLVLTEDGFRWAACDKYSSAEFETGTVPYSILDEVDDAD